MPVLTDMIEKRGPATPARREVATGVQSYVLFRVKQQHLAVPARDVRQLLIMPRVTAVPQSAAWVRGMIQVLGELMPLIDLRVQLGMQSALEETKDVIHLLDEREQDHKNWLADLQASVDEKRAFTLARDPHQCKFGKWYDTYQPENRSVAFLSLWRAFDMPHRRIHRIADRVCDLAARGDHVTAHAVIAETRNTELRAMIGLFDEARRMFRETTREVAMVLRRANRQAAISADEVLAIETLRDDVVESVSDLAGAANTLTSQVIRRQSGDKIALLLDTERLLKMRDLATEPASAPRPS